MPKTSTGAWTAPEQEAIDAATAFALAHVSPHASAWARGAGNSRDQLQAAGEAGLLGLQVRVATGGLGLSFACKSHIAGLLASADFGLAMSLINTHNIAQDLDANGDQALAARYLPD